MKLILLVTGLLLAAGLKAQELPPIRDAEIKRLELGILVSPASCYRTLGNKNAFAGEQVQNLRNQTEIARPGYSAGLQLLLAVSKTISIETGLQYADRGYQTKKTVAQFEQASDNLPVMTKLVYHFRYLDLPLKINLSFGLQRLRFITGIGLTSSLLLSQGITLHNYYADTKEQKSARRVDRPHKHYNFSPTLSAGIDYRLSSHSRILVAPAFQYSLVNTGSADLPEHLRTAYLSFAYYFRL